MECGLDPLRQQTSTQLEVRWVKARHGLSLHNQMDRDLRPDELQGTPWQP